MNQTNIWKEKLCATLIKFTGNKMKKQEVFIYIYILYHQCLLDTE